MHRVDNPYRILRASVLALMGAALTLQMSEALAQGGMSDMKKMPGMNDMKMNDAKTATTANVRSAGRISALPCRRCGLASTGSTFRLILFGIRSLRQRAASPGIGMGG